MEDGNMRKCSICTISTSVDKPDTLFFGEWMIKSDIQVHYYCLLLSTHLPQRGEDCSGILGFLISDIRKEIANAKKRLCKFCKKPNATIRCHNCEEYFHLPCGHTQKCLSQMIHEFGSYCYKCIPPDDVQKKIVEKIPASVDSICYICLHSMGGKFNPVQWIYAKCCMNGYVHSKCMKQYALNAGYYLKCIWCGDKGFRDDIKYQGVFVPDRDSDWEQEKGAYKDLYRKNQSCNMEKCNCPKGRDFISAVKWPIINCILCGSFGVHNPGCIPGLENSNEKLSEFKCDVCLITEKTTICADKTTLEDGNSPGIINDLINTSLYTHKESTSLSQGFDATIDFSDDSISSPETVINYNILQSKPTTTIERLSNNYAPPTLTQSQNEETLQKTPSQKIITSNISILSNDLEETTTDSVATIEINKVIENVDFGTTDGNQKVKHSTTDEMIDHVAGDAIIVEDTSLSENGNETISIDSTIEINEVIENVDVDSAAFIVVQDEDPNITDEEMIVSNSAAVTDGINEVIENFEQRIDCGTSVIFQGGNQRVDPSITNDEMTDSNYAVIYKDTQLSESGNEIANVEEMIVSDNVDIIQIRNNITENFEQIASSPAESDDSEDSMSDETFDREFNNLSEKEQAVINRDVNRFLSMLGGKRL